MLKNKFKSSKLLTNSTKIVATLGILTLAGGSFLKNPFVDASSPISPEMSLSLTLNQGTTLEGIYSKLNNQAGIDIQNIAGEVFIGGKSQPISTTIENDDSVGNSKGTKAMDEYQKSEDNFLNLLNKIEIEGLPASLESQKEVLKPLLDEFTASQVEATKTEATRKPSQITSISLMGSKVAVASTKEKLASVTKEVTELDLVELEAMSKKTQEVLAQKQEEIKDFPKEEQQKVIAETVQSLIQQTLTPAQKQEMANQPKLEMSQEKLELIDSKLSVAPDGSKFINSEVQKILTQTETVEINKALTNFNKLPEATKDGRDSAMQVLEQKIIETKQVAFGELAVSAQECSISIQKESFWWGLRVWHNHCSIIQIRDNRPIS
jgi:hypothetical protein